MSEEARPASSELSGHEHVGNGELLDRSAAFERAGGNVHVLQERVKLFLAECPQLLGDIRRNISSQDAASLRANSDRLRETVNQFGPCHAAVIAANLGRVAMANDWAAAENAFRGLEKAIQRLQPVIAALALDPSA
jgi:hypothetical protein